MKKYLGIVLLIMASAGLHAQILTPVKWSYASKKTGSNEAVLFIKATMDSGWHVYSQTAQKDGPVKTTFTFAPSKSYSLSGNTIEPKPVTRYEKVFKGPISYFAGSVIFQQKIKLTTSGAVTVKGTLEYMTCNDERCLPPDDIDFSITIK